MKRKPTRFECEVERNVPVPMRDGTILYADLWKPKAEGRFPILLQRTPYDKSNSFIAIHQVGLEPVRAIEAGYAVIIQDVRGCAESGGKFRAFENEFTDGYDTLDWASQLPFSDGTVGMYGVSYLGATQLLAAVTKHPALRVIAPSETASEYYNGWTYDSGAFQLGFALFWALSSLAPGELDRRRRAGEDVTKLDQKLQELLVDPWNAYRWLPLKDLNSIHELVPSWKDWILHSSRDNFWKATAINDRYGDVQVPALHIGGWYDIFLKGTLENYLGLKEFAGSENARKNQRLIIGPWAHAVPHSTIGEIDFGPNAGQPSLDMTAVHLDWFGSFLKQGTPNEKAASPVRLFVMGINQWRDEEDWPLARAQMTRFYLHGMGKANQYDGVLSHEPPGEDEPQDMFIYDPHSPVPSVGGSTFLPGLFVGLHAGARDQRLIEQRSDVIVYTSLPLEENTEVTGPVTLTLYASTSAVDTDWTAKLVDVLPDGRANIICDGILRARFRSGLEVPKMLEPDRIYKFLIDMAATSMVFRAGHRIRLEISSSNFPRFDRNPNNGKTSAEINEAQFIVARQMVFHNANYPSHLNLPIIP